jgi:2'-5' RNA ligase
MRLFTGIELAAPVRAALAATTGQLRRHLEARIPDLQARWIPPANLHLTLAFIGEVADSRVPEVANALQRGFATPGFDLELAGAGAFPPSGPPRVAWIGVYQGAAPLRALHGEVVVRLGELGFEFEARPYSPHLTVARLRDVRGPSGRVLREALGQAEVTPAAQRVGDMTLFRSRVSSSGSTYDVVLRVPLRE